MMLLLTFERQFWVWLNRMSFAWQTSFGPTFWNQSRMRWYPSMATIALPITTLKSSDSTRALTAVFVSWVGGRSRRRVALGVGCIPYLLMSELSKPTIA